MSYVDPNAKELTYNPRYDELWTPRTGPENPKVSDFHRASKNTLTGFVEKASFNDFQFENQRRTFMSFGYAIDPSAEVTADKVIGNAIDASEKKRNFSKLIKIYFEILARVWMILVATVFEKTPKRPRDNREKVRNNDSSDVDGFLGPWAVYKDQELTSKPNEEELKEIEEILAKRKKRTRRVEPEEKENKSTMHITDTHDYLGRSFLHIPQDVGVNLKSSEPPEKCFIPKKCVFTYTGHTKGIQKMQMFPVSGHLFLTCSMDSKIKVCVFQRSFQMKIIYLF